MVIKLYIRSCGAGKCTMRTDFKREPSNTPRVANLGLDIVNSIQKIIDECQRTGEVRI